MQAEEAMAVVLVIGSAVTALDGAKSMGLQLRVALGMLRKVGQRDGLMHAVVRESEGRSS